MNIMKTNMLLLDNKIMKEDAGNTTTVEAPISTTTQPQAGMKALTFQGMQNLMANPKLAQEVGVMNDDTDVANNEEAKSYVAPYSSNLAFKGGFKKATTLATSAAILTLAAAMQSCSDKFESSQKQVVIVDTKAIAEAITNGVSALKAQIDALKAEIAALRAEQSAANAAQAQRDQAQLEALEKAVEQLEAIQRNLNNKDISFNEFKNMIYGQNTAIIDAVVTLQGITKEEARAAVDRILANLENHYITEAEAIAQIQALLITNNELLSEAVGLLKDLQASAEKANQQRDSLLSTANEIDKNGKASIYQQQIIISQLGTTIYQNSIQIFNQERTIKAIKETHADLKASIYEVANDLGVRVDALAEAIAASGKSIENVMTMSKEEIIALMEADLAEAKTTNAKLISINSNISHVDNSVQDNTGAIVQAAGEIKTILNKISSLVEANNAKIDYISCLIKNKTKDNSDVIDAINNYAQSNKTTINAATEALSAKLDAFIAKVDEILKKMDNFASTIKQYYDQLLSKFGLGDEILAAIKANGNKIDITNMTEAELKAEFEKIKPELKKLNEQATTSNGYLEIIANRELELKAEIKKLQNIGGDGITKEELEELWKQHDAASYAKYTAFLNELHAEDMDKADIIIDLMTKGNKTASDTYNLLLDFANKNNLTTEELRDLLKAVYEYLPNLICNCNCQSDCDNNENTHEGIIGLLD